MKLVGIHIDQPPQPVTVPLPVVTHREFVAYEPDPEQLKITKMQRGGAWYALVRLFGIDITDTHKLPTIRAQFGGEAPKPSGLLFNDYPQVEPHLYIAREQVDRLSVPTLRTFVEEVNEQLSPDMTYNERKRVLDTYLGSNVGVVALMFMDLAATHFGCPAEDQVPASSVA